MTNLLHDAHTWVAVGFFIFCLVAWKYVVPYMAKALDARASKIKQELDEARNLKSEAESLFKEAEEKLKNADQNAHEIIERARFEAKQIADDAEKEIEREIAHKMKMADEKITRAEAHAIESIKAKAVEHAIIAAKEIIVKELSEPEKANGFAKQATAKIISKVA